jgi:hypothetical protein
MPGDAELWEHEYGGLVPSRLKGARSNRFPRDRVLSGTIMRELWRKRSLHGGGARLQIGSRSLRRQACAINTSLRWSRWVDCRQACRGLELARAEPIEEAVTGSHFKGSGTSIA